MSRARQIIEAAETPRSVISAIRKTRFELGIQDIMRDAKELEARLEKSGVMNLMGWFDDSAVAQAIMQLAIERRGAPGTKRALSAIKRHGHSVL